MIQKINGSKPIRPTTPALASAQVRMRSCQIICVLSLNLQGPK
jgi:hypothetical protein